MVFNNYNFEMVSTDINRLKTAFRLDEKVKHFYENWINVSEHIIPTPLVNFEYKYSTK